MNNHMIYAHSVGATCPECDDGNVVKRVGPHGSFHGCSSFPKCYWNESAVDYRAPLGSEGDWSLMYNPDEMHDYPSEDEMIRGF